MRTLHEIMTDQLEAATPMVLDSDFDAEDQTPFEMVQYCEYAEAA